MKKTMTLKERKELEASLSKALRVKTRGLSTELQGILLDDLVTALQNRLNVLMKAQQRRSY